MTYPVNLALNLKGQLARDDPGAALPHLSLFTSLPLRRLNLVSFISFEPHASSYLHIQLVKLKSIVYCDVSIAIGSKRVPALIWWRGARKK